MSDQKETIEKEEEKVFRFGFGKYKGRTLQQVYTSGVDYLKFLSNQDYLHDETKKEIVDFLESKKPKFCNQLKVK
jgi:hypothetical protein